MDKSDLSPELTSITHGDDDESDDKSDSLKKQSRKEKLKTELNDAQRQAFVYETLKLQKRCKTP